MLVCIYIIYMNICICSLHVYMNDMCDLTIYYILLYSVTYRWQQY